jgi:hypothetical protein
MARSDNFQQFLISDSQSQIVQKLNSNFQLAVEKNGSILSILGATGERGMIGNVGPAGGIGNTGPRGNNWIIYPVAPESDPTLQYGDLWIDYDFNCYELGITGWVFVDSLKRDLGNFTEITGVLGTGGQTSASAIKFNQTDPNEYSFVFADNSPEFSGNLNPDGAKFVISTDPILNGNYIAEFTRDDLDSLSGPTGSALDSSKHPVISWEGLQDESNLSITVPKADFDFDLKSSTENSGINIVNTGDFSMSTSSPGEDGDSSNISAPKVTLSAGGNVVINSAGNSQLTTYGLTLGSGVVVGYGNAFTRLRFNLTPKTYNPEGYFTVSRGKTAANDHNAVTKVPLVTTVDYDGTALARQTNTNYAFTLQTSYNNVLDTDFSVNNLGKVYIRKLREKYEDISIPTFKAFTKLSPTLSQRINWYELPPPDQTDSRIFIIDPSVSAVGFVGGSTLAGASALGVGVDTDKWAGSEFLKEYDTIEYDVYILGNQPSQSTGATGASLSGVSFVGKWSGDTRPSAENTDFFGFKIATTATNYAFNKKIKIQIIYFNGVFYTVANGYNCDYTDNASHMRDFTFS